MHKIIFNKKSFRLKANLPLPHVNKFEKVKVREGVSKCPLWSQGYPSCEQTTEDMTFVGFVGGGKDTLYSNYKDAQRNALTLCNMNS